MRKTILGLAFSVVAFSMNAAAQNTFPASGNVGIGTTASVYPLTVQSPGINQFAIGVLNSHGTQIFGVWNQNDGDATMVLNSASGSENIFLDSTGSSYFMGGNVGIGTTTPGTKLEVDGNVKLTSGSGASITFQDGSVQSTAYTGVTCGGDYAESVDVTGSRAKYEPGDVLVLDTKNPGRVLKSVEAYSTAVSGIYSTKPGVVGRRQTTDPKTTKTEVPMAMVGVVPTKVSAENGAIKVGDLLVSSSTAGYAMKGTDRSKMLGAVIGKAMGNLNAGNGVIEVLVTLQ